MRRTLYKCYDCKDPIWGTAWKIGRHWYCVDCYLKRMCLDNLTIRST